MMWVAGLVFLALQPADLSATPTLCVAKRLGVDFCPGCGLGRSIVYFFHGDFLGSFLTHPLGIVAVGTIAWRIVSLSLLRGFNFVTPGGRDSREEGANG